MFTSEYSINSLKENETIERDFVLSARETPERRKNIPKRYAKIPYNKQKEKKVKYNLQQSAGLYRNLVSNVQSFDGDAVESDETNTRNAKKSYLIQKHSKARKVEEPLKWAVSEG